MVTVHGVVVAAVLASASASLASTVNYAALSANRIDLTFMGHDRGRSAEVSLGGESFSVHAGGNQFHASNGTGNLAWLVGQVTGYTPELDRDQMLRVTGQTFVRSNLVEMPWDSGMPWGPGYPYMSRDRSQAIFNLYNAASGRQYTNDDWAAALQLAIWEVVYDYDPSVPGSWNFTGGNFRVNSIAGSSMNGGVGQRTADLFAMITTNVDRRGIIGLASPVGSDQMLQVVPLPPAAWAGLGLLAMAGVVRRRMGR